MNSYPASYPMKHSPFIPALEKADKILAIMYDISPIPPDNPGRAGTRRYELDLIVSEGLILASMDRINGHTDISEAILRIGYRILPAGLIIPDYASNLVLVYGGEIDLGTENLPDMRTILYYNTTPGGRAAARSLMKGEGFVLD